MCVSNAHSHTIRYLRTHPTVVICYAPGGMLTKWLISLCCLQTGEATLPPHPSPPPAAYTLSQGTWTSWEGNWQLFYELSVSYTSPKKKTTFKNQGEIHKKFTSTIFLILQISVRSTGLRRTISFIVYRTLGDWSIKKWRCFWRERI